MRQLHIRCGKHLPIPDGGSGIGPRRLFRINPGVCAVTALLFLDRGSRPPGEPLLSKRGKGRGSKNTPKLTFLRVQNRYKMVRKWCKGGPKTAQNAAEWYKETQKSLQTSHNCHTHIIALKMTENGKKMLKFCHQAQPDTDPQRVNRLPNCRKRIFIYYFILPQMAQTLGDFTR